MRDTAPIPFPLCSSCPLSFRFLSASFPLSLLFSVLFPPLPLFFISKLRHLDVGTAFVWSQESAYSAGFHIPCDTLAIPYHWFKKKALTTMRDTAPIPFPLCSSCPLSFRFLSASFPPLLFISSSSLLHFFFHFPFFLSSLPFLFLSLHSSVPPLSSA